MTVKERTFLFNCFVWLMNAVLFILIEGGLYLGLMLYVLPQFKDAENSGIVNAILPIILIAGLFVCIAISVNIVTWVIKHFELQDKLNPKLVSRYLKNDKKNK